MTRALLTESTRLASIGLFACVLLAWAGVFWGG